MGKGDFFIVSYKQKHNSKSSTEAELIAVDDCIGHVLNTTTNKSMLIYNEYILTKLIQLLLKWRQSK